VFQTLDFEAYPRTQVLGGKVAIVPDEDSPPELASFPLMPTGSNRNSIFIQYALTNSCLADLSS
jgi:hypothetical protein